jgi:hypothetical protein
MEEQQNLKKLLVQVSFGISRLTNGFLNSKHSGASFDSQNSVKFGSKSCS